MVHCLVNMFVGRFNGFIDNSTGFPGFNNLFLSAICLIYEFTKILILLETYPRPIRDPLETDIPDRRPIRDQHA